MICATITDFSFIIYLNSIVSLILLYNHSPTILFLDVKLDLFILKSMKKLNGKIV